MSAVCSLFRIRLCTFKVSLILIVFHHFFSWIALGTIDLHVYVILVTKANAVKEGTTSAAWLYCHRNQSIHMTGDMSVMSLFASPPTLDKSGHGLCTSHHVKLKSIVYLQYQITLHWKLSYKFKRWCKFSSHIKAKLHKKESQKLDLPIFFHGFSRPFWPHSASVWNRSYFLCLIMFKHLAI